MENQQNPLLIRKLRKKLRQIEHLEALDRDLTDEELSKCMKKEDIRDELLQLLAESNLNNSTASYPSIDDDTIASSSFASANQSFTSAVSETEISLQISHSDDSHTVRQTDLETEDGNKTRKTGETTVNSPPVEISAKRLKESNPASVQPSSSSTTQFKEPSPSKKNKKSTKENSNTKNSLTDQWRKSSFEVTQLDSHNDLVTAVNCCGTLLVSASRDTTVKVWDLSTLTEIRSLGSHTGTVTDVAIIPVKQLATAAENLGVAEDDYVILSGSVDCSIKVWSANTGELLRSIYTYNPITKLAFWPSQGLAVTASDGGKLELWNIDSKENVCSETAHTDSITGLCVEDKRICTSCANVGEIKVYEIRDEKLHCMYASENIRNLSGVSLAMRHVRALNVRGDNLYYGDDGVNVKILSWKKGIVKKIPNHKEEFGMTDAICFHDNLMFTSAYDLDTGQGYVNVFDMKAEPSYITSILADDTRRVLDICCTRIDNGGVTLVTAGLDLLVWRQDLSTGNQSEDLISTTFISDLSKFAQDSDLESDVDFTESEPEAGEGGRGSRRGSKQSQVAGGWTSWCSVL